MEIVKCSLVFKNKKFGVNAPEIVIIHHALHPNCTILDVHKWHLNNGWNGFGYHYFVDKSGMIFEGRKHNQEGAHCTGKNHFSIGICLEGCYTDYKNFTEKIVPDNQAKALVWLLKKINLPWSYHRDHTNTKDCPGIYFLTKNELEYRMTEKITALKSLPDMAKECLYDPDGFLEFVDKVVKIAKDYDAGFLEKAKDLPTVLKKFYYRRKDL